jgi:Putative regulator of cell autolysis
MVISESNSVTAKNRRAVGVFPNRNTAELALYALRDSDFPMNQVSVITKDEIHDDNIAGADVSDSVSQDHVATKVDNKAEEGAAVGITTGGVVGGLTGLLVGLGSIAIPGVGPIMLAGATATAIATTLAGTAIGAATGGLLGALIGLGIPEADAKVYNECIGRGEYLVIVDGNEADIARAHQILQSHNIREYRVYDAPGLASATPAHLNREIIFPDQNPPVNVNGNKQGIGVFSNPRNLEQAITDLRNTGFPLRRISLVSNQFKPEAFTDIEVRDRFDDMGYGIPVEHTKIYHDRLDLGDSVVIVSGTEDEVQRAAPIFRNHKIEQWHVYNPKEIHPTLEQNRLVETPTFTEPGRTNMAKVVPISGPVAYPTKPAKPVTSVGRDQDNSRL